MKGIVGWPVLVGPLAYYADGHVLGWAFWFGVVAYAIGFMDGVYLERREPKE